MTPRSASTYLGVGSSLPGERPEAGGDQSAGWAHLCRHAYLVSEGARGAIYLNLRYSLSMNVVATAAVRREYGSERRTAVATLHVGYLSCFQVRLKGHGGGMKSLLCHDTLSVPPTAPRCPTVSSSRRRSRATALLKLSLRSGLW